MAAQTPISLQEGGDAALCDRQGEMKVAGQQARRSIERSSGFSYLVVLAPHHFACGKVHSPPGLASPPASPPLPRYCTAECLPLFLGENALCPCFQHYSRCPAAAANVFELLLTPLPAGHCLQVTRAPSRMGGGERSHPSAKPAALPLRLRCRRPAQPWAACAAVAFAPCASPECFSCLQGASGYPADKLLAAVR